MTKIRLRYAGTCVVCGEAIPVGSTALWDKEAKTVSCLSCTEAPGERPEPATELHEAEDDPATQWAPQGTAGGSAQRIADRRHEKFLAKNHAFRDRHRIVGSLVTALREEPQSTRAWSKGAAGERKVADRLDSIAGESTLVLHDRRIPGSRANIDHVAVGPRGVFVIDAKFYKGRVQKRDRGGWFSTDWRLYVGRRDCSRLVEGLAKQVAAVEASLGDLIVAGGASITAVLCFVEADWDWFSNGMDIAGVKVVGPRKLAKLVSERGPLAPAQIQTLAIRLAEKLPAA